MKILFISAESPEISIGGIERHIKNLIRSSLQSSSETLFLLPSAKKEGIEKNGNVTIIRKDFLNLRPGKLFGKRTVSRGELKKKSMDFFLFLQDIIRREKPDIVNAQNLHLSMPPIYSLVLNMVCFLENVPMALRMHSFVMSDLEKSIVKDLMWEKIVCVSRSVAGDCFSKDISIDKLHTLYMGVDTNEFKPGLDKNWLKKSFGFDKKSNVILHASRILQGRKDVLNEKGIVTLLGAFSQIQSKYPSLMLAIAVASPPKRLKQEFYYALEKLKGYIRINNLEEKVSIREIKLDDMPLAYNGADIFVLASENETFGQVYLEAMACGVPVIGTNVGGIPEIITDNFNGFLIQPGNQSRLAQRIEELLTNGKIKKEFVKNGLYIVRKKFSSEKTFENLLRYLERVVNLKSENKTKKGYAIPAPLQDNILKQ